MKIVTARESFWQIPWEIDLGVDRPPLRWNDCLNILKVKNWKTVAKSRDAWKKLLEKARAVEPLKNYYASGLYVDDGPHM
ncbi:hypothetical protein TNCV_3632981 [Trichonephila clavipes]|nr:hypothetical protein TNCV_3632981 [Trichonephila clavipes]